MAPVSGVWVMSETNDIKQKPKWNQTTRYHVTQGRVIINFSQSLCGTTSRDHVPAAFPLVTLF